MIKFADVIKKARSRKKLTLRELSDMTMISVVYINQLERGIRYQPSDEYLQRLCHHLDIDYDYACWLTNQWPCDIRDATENYPDFTRQKLTDAYTAFRQVLLT